MTVLCEFNRASGLPNKRLNRPSRMLFCVFHSYCNSLKKKTGQSQNTTTCPIQPESKKTRPFQLVRPPRHVSDRLVTYHNLISAGQSLKPLPCLPDRLPCFEETKTKMASFSSLRLLRDKNPLLCYWSIAMTSLVEFSTGEFGAKKV